PEVVEPAPEVVEPAPEVVEPAPEVVEPAPEVVEPAPEVVEPDAADAADAPDVPPPCTPVAPWTRSVDRTEHVVVFAELAPDAGGWVELANVLVIDVALDGWRVTLDGDEAAALDGFIPARGRRVVPLGDLPSGARLELRNNADRLMDALELGGDPTWPALPAGHTLEKARPIQRSSLGESWAASPDPGGTPGHPPAGLAGPLTLLASGSVWRYDTSGVAPAPAWTTTAFDDAAWASGRAPLRSEGAPALTSVTVRATADNAFALYVGAPDGADLRYVGRDTIGDWTSPEDLTFDAAPGERLFIAAWEDVGDAGSPQMVIADVEGPTPLGTTSVTFDVALAPAGSNPAYQGGIGAPAPPALDVADLAATALFAPPAAEAERSAGPWGGAVGAAFTRGRFIWSDTFDPASATNTEETYALFRSTTPIAAAAGTTLPDDAASPIRLRHSFVAELDPRQTRLVLELDADAGVVVWLNGLAVARDLDAPVTTRWTLPATALQAGDNLLAVELYPDPGALTFDASLVARPIVAAAPLTDLGRGDVVVNELVYHAPPGPDGRASDWLELHNPTAAPVDLSGHRLVDGAAFVFPPGSTLAPGAFLVLASDPTRFARDYPGVPVFGELSGGLSNGGERVALIDRCGALVDAVRYADGGRFPEHADGYGASLELVDPRADNGVPEAWAASDTSGSAPWQTIDYRGPLAPSAVGPDGVWHELVIGLLDAGEVHLDDLVVTEDPDGQAIPVATLDFEGGLGGLRALGTHAASRVEPDPDDPGNDVLRLVATGPSEHMHNHLELTLARPLASGVTYRIQARARWLAGDDQLNTRLYFNRLARTTRLDRGAAARSPGTPGAPNARAANAGPTFRGFALDPVVATPDAPVTLTVLAADPDGVAAVTAHVSIDDAGFIDVPLPAGATVGHGYTTYEATLPAAPAGAVVQVYVAGVDAAGAIATFPAAGAGSRALYPVVAASPSNPGDDPLPRVRLVMTPADQARFHAPIELMSNAYTGATVIVDELFVHYDVGVRAKGSQRGRPSDARLGFSVRFDPLDPFRGTYETVALDRSEGVITGQREILMDLVQARAGSVAAEYSDLARLVAPRAAHSGTALVQAGRYSDLVLDAQFEGGSDGGLFEHELVYYPTTTDTGAPDGRKLPQPDSVVGTSVRDLGADPEAYRHVFLLENRRRADDFAALIAYAQAFRTEDVLARVDLDGWLRGFAFMRLSGAVDHYGAGDQHNAQIYFRPGDPRALLFPHDLDFYGDSRQSVVGGDVGIVIAQPGARRVYYAHVADIVATAYDDAFLDHVEAQLTALLPGQPFASHVAFMRDRAAWVMDGAADAVTVAFPPRAFTITSPASGATTSAASIAIVGSGWLDVWSLARVDGPTPGPLALTWTGDDTWSSAPVPLVPGDNTITLEAHDRRGVVVGSATTFVVRQ
ncbi:MAG: lamin tail domain-containing protein, partial [Deltaproteobacteria bacterium]|nr:lamin tail domain-containing protein [Deltaproteobacteria bacterium]